MHSTRGIIVDMRTFMFTAIDTSYSEAGAEGPVGLLSQYECTPGAGQVLLWANMGCHCQGALS